MKSYAQVVVSGAGLIGCNILCHPCKRGWTDVVLLEHDELTCISTWHAAANTHGLHDNNTSKLQHYTLQLYQQLEAETGQGCGVFQPGSLYLAQTREREHQQRIQTAKIRYFGVDFREISRDEAQQFHPLVGAPIGRVSSGSYRHTVEQSLALGFVKTEFATPGKVLDIAVLGRPQRAVALAEPPPFDAAGKRLRN